MKLFSTVTGLKVTTMTFYNVVKKVAETFPQHTMAELNHYHYIYYFLQSEEASKLKENKHTHTHIHTHTHTHTHTHVISNKLVKINDFIKFDILSDFHQSLQNC